MKQWQKYGVVSLVFIIGVAVGLMLPIRLLNPVSSSTKLTVERDITTGSTYTSYSKDVWFGDIFYQISYTAEGKVLVIGVFGDSSFYETFPAEPDSKFTVFGMEGVISEVHDSYIVVLVKPL